MTNANAAKEPTSGKERPAISINPGKGMKTFIQHKQTGCYCFDGGWTADINEALSFPSSLEALDYCCRNGIRQVVLVLVFGDPRFNVYLHVFNESGMQSAPSDHSPSME